jgi:NAD+ diphosphatase
MDMRMAYAGCTLDRATHLRADTACLAELLRAPSTRIVPVWRDRSLITTGSRPRLWALTGEAAGTAISLAHEVAFLGLDGEGAPELEDARWFDRTEVAEIRSLGLRLPFRGTIARALIEAWLAGDEVGAG